MTNTIQKIEVPVDITKLSKEVFQNLPEYSQSLDCLGWSYKKMEFQLFDVEENKKYLLTLEKIEKGFIKFLQKKVNDKNLMHYMDPAYYDADDVDVIIQYALFGEIIYG